MPASNKQLLVYTVTDLNGNKHQVPVEADSVKNATWPEIIQAAKDKGITIGNTPSGYTGNWKDGGSNLNPNDTTTQISPNQPNQPITPDFTKSLTYTVGADTITVSVKYPETEATWEQIKTAAKAQPGSTFDENLLWKDGNGKLVSSPKKYPAGTSFTSSTSTNAATGGSADRVVTVDKTNRTPEVGDKLYKDPNGKGWIIAKADPSKDGVTGWTLLGHVYDVDTTTGIVSVVSKEIGNAKWARQGGAVYDSKVSGSLLDPPLSKKLVTVTNGYDAWREVGGKLEINNGNVVNEGETTPVASKDDVKNAWNPNALFRNYDAISWALCYPASNKKRNELDSKHPLYAAGNTKVLDWLAAGNWSGEGAKPYTKEVVQVISGTTVESRWYLPSVAELKKVYAAGDKLLNWDDGTSNALKGNNFWSVEVNTYTYSQASDYDAAKEKQAWYVNFTNGTAATADKQTSYKALAVAQFNYTTM